MGNTEVVARKHYRRTTDTHFEMAIGAATPKATRNPARAVAETGVFEVKSNSLEMQKPLVSKGFREESTGHNRTRIPAQTLLEIALLSQGDVNSDVNGPDEGSSEGSFDPSLVRLLRVWGRLSEDDCNRLADEAERLAEAAEKSCGT